MKLVKESLTENRDDMYHNSSDDDDFSTLKTLQRNTKDDGTWSKYQNEIETKAGSIALNKKLDLAADVSLEVGTVYVNKKGPGVWEIEDEYIPNETYMTFDNGRQVPETRGYNNP